MDGEIGFQDKQTIILYSPQESSKRMEEYRQEKKELKEKILVDGNSTLENSAEKTVSQENISETEAKVEETHETAPKKKTKTKQMKIDDITQ